MSKIGRFEPRIEVKSDGLYTDEVRVWSLEKYKLVGSYCDIFTSGMKSKWDQLVYIDLFAGAGYAKIKESKKTYLNSALIAMSLPNPFTKYILCEQNKDRIEALTARVERDFGHLNYEIIHSDSNSNVEKIINAIPSFGKGNTLLSFCFVDPYSLDLNFETIKALAKNIVDFLILQALHMDANRNFDNYLKEENNKIAQYLGLTNWRELFERDAKNNRKDFVKFLSDQYQDQMVKLGYLKQLNMHSIRSNEKNLPLYYLSFYTKNKTGEKFFKEIEKRVSPQFKLDL
jgi:three-Cys-motif partner protein